MWFFRKREKVERQPIVPRGPIILGRSITLTVGDVVDIARFGKGERVTIKGLTRSGFVFFTTDYGGPYVETVKDFKRLLIDSGDVVESLTTTYVPIALRSERGVEEEGETKHKTCGKTPDS